MMVNKISRQTFVSYIDDDGCHFKEIFMHMYLEWKTPHNITWNVVITLGTLSYFPLTQNSKPKINIFKIQNHWFFDKQKYSNKSKIE